MRLPATRKRANRANREGATLVLIAVLLPMLMVLAAFAINVSHMESVRTEVQIATDAAARAAGREYLSTRDKNKALIAAQDMSSRNPVNGFVVPISFGDLEFGVGQRSSTGQPYTFTNTGSGNAVRLTTNSFADGSHGIQPMFPFLSAGSVKPRLTAVCTQGVIDVALVVDRSGSMAYGVSEVAAYPPIPSAAPVGWDFGQPVPPDARWLDLVSAVDVFIDELNDSPTEEHLSLTVYDEFSTALRELSSNYSPVLSEMNIISASFEKGGTNIGSGMLKGKDTLINTTHGRSDASKVIVVLTDGVHNIGTDPVKAAKTISKSGITMFTVTFSNEADQAKMKLAAEACGGEHFHAVDAAQLRDVFKDIARSLPSLLTE